MHGLSLKWINLSHWVAQFGFISSSLFGGIVIYLNVFLMKNVFGTYKTLMTTFTALGIYFAVLEMVVYPNIHFYNAGLLFFTVDNLFDFSKETLVVGLELYGCMYATTISCLAVQFIYRYWVVFHPSKVEKYFQGRVLLIWPLYCIFFGIQWASGLRAFCNVDTESVEYFEQEMLLYYNASVIDIPAKTLLAYNLDGSVRWWNLMATLNMSSIMISQYSLMIYSGWKMHYEMEEKLASFSVDLKKRNRQFLKALILQITTPTITLFSPIVMIVYAPIFNFNMSVPFGPVLCGFSLYPAMDALIVLTVLSEYRKTLRREVLKRLIVCLEKLIKEEQRENPQHPALRPRRMTTAI